MPTPTPTEADAADRERLAELEVLFARVRECGARMEVERAELARHLGGEGWASDPAAIWSQLRYLSLRADRADALDNVRRLEVAGVIAFLGRMMEVLRMQASNRDDSDWWKSGPPADEE